ncbi:MAG TPA: glycerophosphodiester phosphodiesterase [Acidimicrobiales bacterium]|nr:glycerophosphodiester phosphodiesterase [Acidimicrobiales bacterium]
MTAWAFLDHPGPIPFAHRGGAAEGAENTMPAFEHAVRLGYRYLETDVHATADGVLVAFHDNVLDRVTDRQGVIGRMPWDDVRQARVGDDGIPLLVELLSTWPDVRVNIDIKHEASIVPLVEVLNRAGAHDRVCVASFSGKRLDRFRNLTGGRVCTATSPRDIARIRLAGLGLGGGRFAAACTQVPVRQGPVVVVSRQFVDAAHRRQLPVHVWTIDDPDEMERLLDLGVDGIMTDRPTVLKEVLVRRGQWVEAPWGN